MNVCEVRAQALGRTAHRRQLLRLIRSEGALAAELEAPGAFGAFGYETAVQESMKAQQKREGHAQGKADTRAANGRGKEVAGTAAAYAGATGGEGEAA
jgi:hypothetical protein